MKTAFVCTVFNENKACLVNMAGNENLRDQLEQCPEPPRPSPNRPFCMWDILIRTVLVNKINYIATNDMYI